MGFLLWCGQGLIVPYGAAAVVCGCPGARLSDIGRAVALGRTARSEGRSAFPVRDRPAFQSVPARVPVRSPTVPADLPSAVSGMPESGEFGDGRAGGTEG
ncbi:hypothetical protein Stube_48250 [Streptomyces tubercidicus]|uniref:Uncharacterized protein n=1 Tax=Streptomyces tubercidicus TaxID=47759 RepID=A0A640UXU1_9ACTN|nr:hypothetical protein Stube_48250 [Streptomyces tubercidicus]